MHCRRNVLDYFLSEFLNLGIIGRRHPAFLNLLTAVIHVRCDERLRVVSKTHSPRIKEKERKDKARERHARAKETGSGGISSESETDGQKYRHGNKEGEIYRRKRE